MNPPKVEGKDERIKRLRSLNQTCRRLMGRAEWTRAVARGSGGCGGRQIPSVDSCPRLANVRKQRIGPVRSASLIAFVAETILRSGKITCQAHDCVWQTRRVSFGSRRRVVSNQKARTVRINLCKESTDSQIAFAHLSMFGLQ